MKTMGSFTNQACRCGLALIITLLLGAATCAADYVSVKKDGTNIRASASTSSEVLCEVFAGYPLRVLKRNKQWAHVSDFEGDKGWIRSGLLSPEKTVIVNAKKANIREEPNTAKSTVVVAVARYGVVFTPLAKKGEWLKVSHADGTVGWLKKDLVWPTNPLK